VTGWRVDSLDAEGAWRPGSNVGAAWLLAAGFPGFGWTYRQGGSYGLMMRNMGKKIGGL